MDVRTVDVSATKGTSALHTASPVTKLTAFALVLAAVVVQSNVLVVASIGAVLVSAVVAFGLPVRRLLSLAAYPGIFALLFAFASAPDVLTGALFFTKAVTAALAALTLAFTTPYPFLFAPIQRVTPGVVGDAMLMTYRSLFLLGEQLEALRTAVKLRSGLSRGHPIRAAGATARALGSLVLYALDLAEREYDVMRLRGYSDRLRVTLPRPASVLFDVALVAAAAIVLVVAVLWRVGAAALNPFSWLPVLAAGALLLAGSIWRYARR